MGGGLLNLLCKLVGVFALLFLSLNTYYITQHNCGNRCSTHLNPINCDTDIKIKIKPGSRTIIAIILTPCWD